MGVFGYLYLDVCGCIVYQFVGVSVIYGVDEGVEVVDWCYVDGDQLSVVCIVVLVCVQIFEKGIVVWQLGDWIGVVQVIVQYQFGVGQFGGVVQVVMFFFGEFIMWCVIYYVQGVYVLFV